MEIVRNYIGGQWREAAATEFMDVINPATPELLARTPLSSVAIMPEASRLSAPQARPVAIN